ncbi:MAG: hypothetical protein PHT19_01655 [Methylococcus sp.]|nr:hypothetical protein [Methylococcus sp.]
MITLLLVSGTAFAKQDCSRGLFKKPVWCLSREVGEAANAPVKTAVIASANTIGRPASDSAKGRGILRLRHAPEGYKVTFEVPGASIDPKGCLLGVRFDHKSPGIVRCWTVSGLAVIDGAEVFVAKIKTAKHMLIEATLTGDGTHVFEFDIANLDQDF